MRNTQVIDIIEEKLNELKLEIHLLQLELRGCESQSLGEAIFGDLVSKQSEFKALSEEFEEAIENESYYFELLRTK